MVFSFRRKVDKQGPTGRCGGSSFQAADGFEKFQFEKVPRATLEFLERRERRVSRGAGNWITRKQIVDVGGRVSGSLQVRKVPVQIRIDNCGWPVGRTGVFGEAGRMNFPRRWEFGKQEANGRLVGSSFQLLLCLMEFRDKGVMDSESTFFGGLSATLEFFKRRGR